MARTRVLDVESAIIIAMELFWRNGYERTSLADLTAAMAIAPPSLYFAFGSKEGLFLRVLEHYRETRLKWAEEALKEPTAEKVADVMLHRLADLYSDADLPSGCLIVNCSLPCADDTTPIRQEIARLRDAGRERLRKRFQKALKEGDLPSEANPAELARYVMVVAWGLAFDAQGGATREHLHLTVTRALSAWPRDPKLRRRIRRG